MWSRAEGETVGSQSEKQQADAVRIPYFSMTAADSHSLLTS